MKMSEYDPRMTITPSQQDAPRINLPADASHQVKRVGLPATTVHGATAGASQSTSTAADHLAGWQRARADYENLLRRMEHDLAHAAEAAKDQLLLGLLPIADYFSAAARHIPDSLKKDPWAEGILRIHQAFDGFLKNQGVTLEEAVGIPLDPARHEAIAEVKSTADVGTIVEVITPGYARSGRVLRPARVSVSRGIPVT